MASRPPVSDLAAKKPLPVFVDSRIVKKQDYQIVLSSFGIVHARTRSNLMAQVGGQIVSVSPNFRAGAFVEKNEVLLTIDPIDYEVELEVSKSELAKAKLALDEEQAQSDIAASDWKTRHGNAPATDLVLRKPHRQAAEAALVSARARVKLAQANLRRTEIRAPYSGRIVKTQVDLGSSLTPGMQVAEIYSTAQAEIRLPVKSQDIQWLDLSGLADGLRPDSNLPHRPVKFLNNLYRPVEKWQGRLVRSEASLDQASQQLYVIAEIADPFMLNGEPASAQKHPLKVGQYLDAELPGKLLKNKIVIDNSIIRQGSFVYVIEQDSLQRRQLQILWRDASKSVIESGLEEGDRVVMTPLGQVPSGTRVALKKPKPVPAPVKNPEEGAL